MLSYPKAEDLVETIAADMYARREMSGFALRVAANGLAIAAAEMRERERIESEGAKRIQAILGAEGAYESLNAALCERIASGDMALDDPALLDHLWATTMDVLAVEQPRYATFKTLRG